MAHSRRGFRGRGISDSQRRKKTWISVKQDSAVRIPGDAQFLTAITITTPLSAAAGGAISDAGFILVSDPEAGEGDEVSTLPEECTILRARGSLLFPANGIPSTGGRISEQFVFGFGVTDIRSLVLGVTPGPIIDSDWDGWMFLRQSGSKPVDSQGTLVDVKAMRKIKTGDAFFFAAQSVSGDGNATPAGDFIFDLRLLILLP